MAADVMRVRLGLRRIRVLEVLVDEPVVLRVRVESTETRPRCPHCGFKCHRVHDVREREIRDLPASGRPVTLVWMRRRMVCDNCGSRWLEDHDTFDGKVTVRLAKQLVADAQVTADPGGGSPSWRDLVGDQLVCAGVVGSDRDASPL